MQRTKTNKILSLLLAVCLVAGLLPGMSAPALAAGATGTLDIDGETGKSLTSDQNGTGWEWKANTATLILGSDYQGGKINIDCQNTDTVYLDFSGSVRVSATDATPIYCNGKLIINGTGTLTANYNKDQMSAASVQSAAGLVINSGTVKAVNNGSSSLLGALAVTSNGIVITGDANVEIEAIEGAFGMMCNDGLTIDTAGSVDVSGNISAYDDDIYISGGSTMVTGDVETSGTLYVTSGTVNITGDVTKFNGNGGNLTVSNGTVVISGTVEGTTTHTGGTLNGSTPGGGTTATGSMDIGGFQNVSLTEDHNSADCSSHSHTPTGWTWTAGTATLALTNAYSGSNNIDISCAETDTINLEYSGNVSIENPMNSISCQGNLNVSGSGTLTLTSSNLSGLYVKGAIDISSGTIVAASGGNDGYGIWSHIAGITIRGTADVTATGSGSGGRGIFAPGSNSSITISTSGTVVADGGAGEYSVGIDATNVVIESGTITIKGYWGIANAQTQINAPITIIGRSTAFANSTQNIASGLEVTAWSKSADGSNLETGTIDWNTAKYVEIGEPVGGGDVVDLSNPAGSSRVSYYTPGSSIIITGADPVTLTGSSSAQVVISQASDITIANGTSLTGSPALYLEAGNATVHGGGGSIVISGGGGGGIQAKGLTLTGTFGNISGTYNAGISATGNVIISGTVGDITSGTHGIHAKGSVTITETGVTGDISGNGTFDGVGIYAEGGNVAISGTVGDITGVINGIDASGLVTLYKDAVAGTVSATSTSSSPYGISAGGSISINTPVIVKGGNSATGGASFNKAPIFDSLLNIQWSNDIAGAGALTGTPNNWTSCKWVKFYDTDTTLPGAPTGITVTNDTGTSVDIGFTAPSHTGSSAITGYTVTANPGGITATGIGSPITVTGLTNSTTYTFSVTATNGQGTGPAGTSAPWITGGGAATTYTTTITIPMVNGKVPAANVSNPAAAAADATVNLPTVTANPGFTFSTWAVTSGGVTLTNPTSANTASFTMGSANVTVEARFTANGLTFNDRTLSAGRVDTTYNESVTAATGGSGSYTYAITNGILPTGLSMNAMGIFSGTPTAVAGNTTFTVTATDTNTGATKSATYTITIATETYNVTVTGGTVGGVGSSAICAEGATVTITAATAQTGYQFKEWTVNSGDVTFDNASSATTTFIMPAESVSVTANYEPITYTISYNLNGGSGTTPTEANKAEGATFAAAAITGITAPNGKQFKEWNTAQGGTGTAYAPGATVTMPGAALTLYAIWEDIPVTTYAVNVNSGTGGGNYEAGATVTITADAPTSGKRFKEWTVDNGGAALANKNDASTSFTMPANAVTVTATYEALPADTYSITVQNDGNGTANANVNSAQQDATINLTATPNSGYQFKEWQVIAGGMTITSNSFTMPAENVTVKAIFELIPTTNISAATVSGVNASYTYTGSAIAPTPVVKISGATLVANTDYTVAYNNNINVGTATITITGIGTYSGIKIVTFGIQSSGGGDNGGNGGGGGGGTTTTPTTPETGDNKLTTPKGQAPVVDNDGNTTLPGGGTVTTPGGGSIDAPSGTTIDKDGNVTIPNNKEADVKLPGGTEVTLPGGSTISNDGEITIPTGKTADTKLPGGAEITLPGGSTISNSGNITIGGNTQVGLSENKTLDISQGSTITDDGKLTVGAGGASLHSGGLTLNLEEDTEIILDMDIPLGYLVLSNAGFSDVSGSAWYADSVSFVYNHGLFKGVSANEFAPNTPMNRAMLATVLARLGNANLHSYGDSRFGDVPSGQYYTGPIEWAADMGIVNGVGNGMFDPNAEITREQLAVMLYNFAKAYDILLPSEDKETFADEGDISTWAQEAVKALQAAGVINGKGNNLFDPKSTATRAEVATMLENFVLLVMGE